MVALNATTLERLTDRPEPTTVPGGRTELNWPPTYITPWAKATVRTTPFVCQERFGGFAASASPGAGARGVVTTAPITHARLTAGTLTGGEAGREGREPPAGREHPVDPRHVVRGALATEDVNYGRMPLEPHPTGALRSPRRRPAPRAARFSTVVNGLAQRVETGGCVLHRAARS